MIKLEFCAARTSNLGTLDRWRGGDGQGICSAEEARFDRRLLRSINAQISSPDGINDSALLKLKPGLELFALPPGIGLGGPSLLARQARIKETTHVV